MGAIRNFVTNASPTAKMFMALAVTTGFVISYKYLYAPYARRQRYRRAEDWADWLIEQEQIEKDGTSQYEQH